MIKAFEPFLVRMRNSDFQISWQQVSNVWNQSTIYVEINIINNYKPNNGFLRIWVKLKSFYNLDPKLEEDHVLEPVIREQVIINACKSFEAY